MKLRILTIAISLALTGLSGIASAGQPDFGPIGFKFGMPKQKGKAGLLDHLVAKRPPKVVTCHSEKEHTSNCQAVDCCVKIRSLATTKDPARLGSSTIVCKQNCPMRSGGDTEKMRDQ